ncbi:MAG TPA: tetratricopeptide repeat protein [Allosphingosinicella sp.]|jgi:TolA-binding protein
MRIHLLGIALMAGVAFPAAAQQTDRIDRRVDRLEQEMRAVQRRVFPGANGSVVGPEIQEQARPVEQSGVPGGSAVSDLTARVDALETQLARLTGQVEQNGNRLRQLETALASVRESTASRLEALEKPGTSADEPAADQPTAAVETPRRNTTTPAPAITPKVSTVALGDDPEAAYNAGFRLWEQKKYKDAQQLLDAVAKKWPKHRFGSWAANLAGRAYLDDGNPTAAARVLFANYDSNPKGERAADSLFFLGQALLTLKKPAEACKAYDELQDVYGATMRDWLKERLPAARTAAKCK